MFLSLCFSPLFVAVLFSSDTLFRSCGVFVLPFLSSHAGSKLFFFSFCPFRFFYSQALKVLDFALMKCEVNCQLFVEKLGLKFLFSIFMRKSPPLQQKRKRTKAQDRQDEGDPPRGLEHPGRYVSVSLSVYRCICLSISYAYGRQGPRAYTGPLSSYARLYVS